MPEEPNLVINSPFPQERVENPVLNQLSTS